MRLKKRPEVRRGAVVVEMAIDLIILLPLVLGTIEAARMCMVTQLLTNAAREGCRVAVTQATNTSAGDSAALGAVNARIIMMLSGSGITPGSLTEKGSDPGTTGAYIMPTNWSSISNGSPPLGTAITVVVRVPFSSVNWLPALFLFPSSTYVAGSATLAKQHAPQS